MTPSSKEHQQTELRWLEIIADYRCNNRCIGCYSVMDDGPSMDRGAIVKALHVGRTGGASRLWLGGGEPTLRRDMFWMVKRARKMGFTHVKLQTNGMLLAYPKFAARCAESGVTEACFAIKGATARTHDALTATPGCHELMERGIVEALRAGLHVTGDILVYEDNTEEILEMVRHYAGMGVSRFSIWLLCSTDAGKELWSQVPRISEVVPHITRAMDLGLSPDPGFIVSLHTPPCTVPESHHDCLFQAADLGLLVANPGDHYFKLETSPIEGGLFLDRCDDCRHRSRCNGMRRDYVAIHGNSEFCPRPDQIGPLD